MKPPYAIGSVPSLSGHAVAYRWRSLPRVRRHRASKPQGSSERVLPWQITMDQLIFASLSHTHYWYEVGMLKVPAVVPPTESLRFVASELGKSDRNLEQIGAKFLGPNRFGVFFLNMAERLLTCSRFRAYWKIGSEFGLV